MRIPLAVSLESRDGTVDQDAKVLNGMVEVQGEGDGAVAVLRKRPGTTDIGLLRVGTAQALTYWNGAIRAVIGDYLIGGNTGSYATWNPSDKGNADLVLSNGNLTATVGTETLGTRTNVRSTVSKSAGKWYWEYVVQTANKMYFAVANSSASLTTDLGNDNNSLALIFSGNILKNGVIVGFREAVSVGQTVSIAYDADAGTVAFRVDNGTATTISGADVPTGALYAATGSTGNNPNGAVTANFGASAQTYSPPSGYTAGLSFTSPTFVPTASTALSPTAANLPFSFQDNGSNAPTSYLMLKNASQAWTLNSSGTVAAITDVDYPGTYAVTLTSLTRSGTTATATVATDTNFQVGSSVTIAGATPSTYNGAQTITGVTPTSVVESVSATVTITRSGTTATATSADAPHGFTNGQTVTIAGANEAAYNGNFVITWVSATVFTFTVTVTTGGGSTQNNNYVSPATGTPAYSHYLRSQYSTASVVGTTATVTTSGGHGLTTGMTIASGVIGGRGFASGSAVTVSDANTFTVSVSGTSITEGSGQSCSYYISAQTISSITASGNTATVTTASAHGLISNDWVLLSGATQTYYNANGQTVITKTGATTFTYQLPILVTVADTPASPATGTITAKTPASITGSSFTFTIAGSPATPATGTITATGGRNTVPGIAYLNGRFYVMDIYGVIYNCAEDDPSSWNALEFIPAQNETGAGVCLAKSLNFIIAFKEWSTEFFYDAGEFPGSPLGPVDNGFTQIGCASGFSVAELDGALLWIAQARKQRGRSVYVMSGTEQRKVSTPDVERILNADDLATVHAYGLKLDGHRLNLLTLVTSNITLAYDMDSGFWYEWSTLTIGSSKSVSSITRSGTTATVTCGVAHTVTDGSPVTISGADQSEYNGIFQAAYVSSTVFTIEVTGSPATPATGTILAYPYTETYLKYTKAANVASSDMVLHESDGHMYEIDSAIYQDDGVPINLFARLQRIDGGTQARKKMGRISVVGEYLADTAMIRFSDDDCATFTAYRRVTLSDQEPNIRRCGAFKRRTIEIRHIGNTSPRLKALEMEVGQ